MSKKLVVYFSASGVTRAAAEKLSEAAEADLYEIRPAVPYTAADLDWTNGKSRSSVEMQDKACRVPMADADVKVAAYDVIFLGFPIWWYTAPSIIRTFLEAGDFAGKTIVLFATSGGSGFGNTAKDLQGSAHGADIREGKLLNGRPSAASLKKWLDALGV
ncbi:flavodoxin [Pyramidobacter sp.]|uniref:flavodoxin n=1 Tax=Pyramidobacter sp. TaxID=1943581 RepID=UPI003327773A